MTLKDSRPTRRNSECTCGSGLRYKYCCGALDDEDPTRVPEGVRRKQLQIEKRRAASSSALLHGRPVIATEFAGQRIVAVGSSIVHSPARTTRFFFDFLSNFLKDKLGADWGNRELLKPLARRHQVLQWYDQLCELQRKQPRNPDGTFEAVPDGGSLAWYRLAYDLYLVQHNANLQARLLERLRNPRQFQGARFELSVAAAMALAGYSIEFDDDSDSSKKHVEFRAVDRLGAVFAVEAKSRHRHGVMQFEQSPRFAKEGTVESIGAKQLLKGALDKNPDHPYFVFIEVNLPPALSVSAWNKWRTEMRSTVEDAVGSFAPGQFPASAVLFCNDPLYHVATEAVTRESYWCYPVAIENCRFPLSSPHAVAKIAEALLARMRIPVRFPD